MQAMFYDTTASYCSMERTLSIKMVFIYSFSFLFLLLNPLRVEPPSISKTLPVM